MMKIEFLIILWAFMGLWHTGDKIFIEEFGWEYEPLDNMKELGYIKSAGYNVRGFLEIQELIEKEGVDIETNGEQLLSLVDEDENVFLVISLPLDDNGVDYRMVRKKRFEMLSKIYKDHESSQKNTLIDNYSFRQLTLTSAKSEVIYFERKMEKGVMCICLFIFKQESKGKILSTVYKSKFK